MIIGNRNTPSTQRNPGCWTPGEIALRKSVRQWNPQPDPYWTDVQLLIQPAVGDSSIVDKSSYNRPLLVANAAGINISEFNPFGRGTRSVYLPNGSAVYVPQANVFSLPGDFLVEMLFCKNNPTCAPFVMHSNALALFSDSGGYVDMAFQGSVQRLNSTTIFESSYHNPYYLAFLRSNGATSAYLNGCRIGQWGYGGTVSTSNLINIGGDVANNANYIVGHLFGCRMTTNSRGLNANSMTIPWPEGPWPVQ
jgi:hypothetical protein